MMYAICQRFSEKAPKKLSSLTGNCKSIADAADNKNLWIFIPVNTNFILWNTKYENIKQRDENINEKMMELESIEWMTNI